MPTAGNKYGQNYVPNPVDHQVLRQNEFTDLPGDSYMDTSVS